MKECNHVVAVQYGEEESGYTGELINLSEVANNAKIIESKYNDVAVFNFCPNCGEKLSKHVENAKQTYRDKVAEQKRIKEEKELENKRIFEERKNNVLKLNDLSFIDDNHNYAVFATFIRFKEKKKALLQGTKSYIVDSIARNTNMWSDQNANVFYVYKNPSLESFLKACLERFENAKGEIKLVGNSDAAILEFNDGKDDVRIDYSGCTVYMSKKDEDGDSDYFQYDPEMFIKEMNIDLEVEKLFGQDRNTF